MKTIIITYTYSGNLNGTNTREFKDDKKAFEFIQKLQIIKYKIDSRANGTEIKIVKKRDGQIDATEKRIHRYDNLDTFTKLELNIQQVKPRQQIRLF